jgi:hypothetical protein
VPFSEQLEWNTFHCTAREFDGQQLFGAVNVGTVRLKHVLTQKKWDLSINDTAHNC